MVQDEANTWAIRNGTLQGHPQRHGLFVISLACLLPPRHFIHLSLSLLILFLAISVGFNTLGCPCQVTGTVPYLIYCEQWTGCLTLPRLVCFPAGNATVLAVPYLILSNMDMGLSAYRLILLRRSCRFATSLHGLAAEIC